MGKILVGAILILVVSVAAQNAKVIHLNSADQAKVKRLYAELQAAQNAWSEFNVKIADKYAVETLHSDGTLIKNCLAVNSKTGKGVDCRPATRPKEGWENGFAFSEDFSVIVPQPSTPQPSTPLIFSTDDFSSTRRLGSITPSIRYR